MVLPIDFAELTNITTDMSEIAGQIAKLQEELAKPMKRIRMLTLKKDQFGDDITDEQKEALFAKAKEEYISCKAMCEKTIRELPKMKREEVPGRN